MDILYYFANDGTPMWTWQKYHIFDELEKHDILVHEFNPRNYDDVAVANSECLMELKKENYDLFMTCQAVNDFVPETLISIKDMGIPMVLLHFDNKMDPRRYLDFSRYFDLVVHLNEDDNPVYKKYRTKYVVAPYASNPFYFTPKDVPATNGICFVGTPYGTRCHPINVLTNAGIKVNLFANQSTINSQKRIADGMTIKNKISAFLKMAGSKSGRKVILSAFICKAKKQEHLNTNSELLVINSGVNHERMNEIYSSYSLCLSMPEARNTGVLKKPVNICHLRNFEIPMCGGLQITKYDEELAQYFEDGKEIIFYHTDEELIEKVKYYTDPKNAELVKEMKINARRRAEKEHTWFLRFRKAFREIGIEI